MRDTNYFYFDGGTTAQRDSVRAGIADWHKGLDYNAARLATSLENSSGSNAVKIVFGVFSNPEKQGEVLDQPNKCDTVALSNSLSGEDMRGIARHEWGHVLGLRHSGINDVFYNGDVQDSYPAMSTCNSNYRAPYKQDDEAAFGSLHSALWPRALVGNIGFERGNTIWTRAGSSSVATYKQDFSQAANGGYYVHFRNVSGSDHLYQTISYFNRGGQWREVQTLANFRLPPASYSSTASGYAKVETVMRSVSFTNDGCSAFDDGRKHNGVRSTGGFFIAQARSCPVGANWGSCSADIASAYFAHDIKTRAYSDVKDSSGNLVGVEIDDLRTRDITP